METTKTSVLRQRAEEGIAALRSAEAAYAAAVEKLQSERTEVEKSRSAGTIPRHSRLRIVVAEIALYTVEDEMRRASAIASAALDAAESAEGDTMSTACDPTVLREKLAVLVHEEERLLEELGEVAQRRATLMRDARTQSEELAKRRRQAKLPPPRFEIQFSSAAGREAAPTLDGRALAALAATARTALSFVDTLCESVAIPPTPAKTNKERLRPLLQEETQLRAALEQAHQEALEREKERDANDRYRAREAKRRAEAEMAERERRNAEYAAEREKTEALAEAQRRREEAERTALSVSK